MNESAWNDVLSNHKIDKVTFYRFRARYPRLHGKNARLSYHGFGGEVLAAVFIPIKVPAAGVLSVPIFRRHAKPPSVSSEKS